MANFGGIVENKLKKVFSEEQAGVLMEVLSDVKALTERDLVRAGDFNELKEIVKELAEAQGHTERRIGALTERVEKLAEKVEKLTEKVEELAEAQKRTEQRVEKLAEKVEELAEAQRKTERRFESLIERVEELAESQKITEEEIKRLVVGLTNTRSDLGGLQRSFGYMLENEAYRSLPSIMREKFGIEVKERFLRKYFKLADGTEAEINVLGKGVKNGEEVSIVGEAKSILEGKDVDHFIEVLEALKGVIGGPMFKIFVTHSARPSVERYAMENSFQVIYTYEL